MTPIMRFVKSGLMGKIHKKGINGDMMTGTRSSLLVRFHGWKYF